jgi:DNA replication and repair protein RecF
VECEYHSQLEKGIIVEMLGKRALIKTVFWNEPSVGIHKDDLVFSMKALPLKRFCFSRPAKILCACHEAGTIRIVEAAQSKNSHCYCLTTSSTNWMIKRVAQLIELLVKGDFGQVFITDTHPERAEEMAKRYGGDYKKMVIENGIGPSNQVQ